LPHPTPVTSVMWSAEGQLLASGDDEGYIRLWTVDKTEPAVCVKTIHGHTDWVDALAFAPDTSALASASWDGTVKLWEVSSGHLQQTLSGHTDRVGRLAWSSDGRTLASGGRDHTIWLWDVVQRSYRAALHEHSGPIYGLAFTPDSRSLLSGSEDGTVRVWDMGSGQCIRVIQGYAAFLYVVDWSPDGGQLVSGSLDTLVTIWDANGGVPPRSLQGHTRHVCGVAWSPDGRWLASSEWDNALRLWDSTSGVCLQVLQHPDYSGNCFFGLAWRPDGQRLAAGTYRFGAKVFDMTAPGHRWDDPVFQTAIRPVAWRPDGAQLAGGGDDGAVYVWGAEDGALLYRLPGHHSMITSVSWSPSGTRLASGSGSREGGELFVWDVQRGERVRPFAEPPGIVSAVAWGASEDVLISGGSNGNLRWWDVQSGGCVRVRQAHQGTVQSLRRSPDGTKLASCGDDGAIMLWDLASGEHLQTLRRDRPYERMEITDLTGITAAQRVSLLALGAVERPLDRASALATTPHSEIARQPARSEQQVASNLPSESTSFIGRSAELAAIARLLADPQCRLLTLLGPGGIGKTRLALAVAAAQIAAFPDGVAFVALTAVGTASQIVTAIGDTLHLDFGAQPDPTAHLLGYLRTRHMLLVLDSFEHLLDGADLVADILAHAPQLTLLITSRERLDLHAEWVFDVEGLAYPHQEPPASGARQRLAALNDYSAVQLFVQRATQVQPGLVLDEATLTTIARICEHVAGMPLAIELAAAAVRLVPISEIERQIGAHLDVLAATYRDVPLRHRSMRAVFDHSWNLLSEGERALFSHVAVFRGGWTAEAAEQVAGATLVALTVLVDKSLVRLSSVEPRTLAERTGQNAAGAPRFVMLEPIREYALEQLAARGEAAALQHAHASYYLALAEAAMEQWDTPTVDASIALLDREHDNLRAALQSARDGGDRTIGLQLAGVLWRFWRIRGYLSEGRVWLEELLTLDEDPSDATAQAARLRALEGAAWLASHQHDYARATQLFEQSMMQRRALGEAEGETNLLGNAAIEARAVGQYQRARALLEDAMARQRALADRGGIGSAGLGQSLYLLGLVRREQGDFAGARVMFEECMEFHRTLGDGEGMAVALLGLGDIARDQGDAAQLRRYCEESLALLRKLGVQWATGFALNNLALGAYLEGDLTRAFALASESVALFRSLQADASLAEVLITLGQIRRAQGDVAAAQAALAEALRLALAVGPRLLVASALEGLANVMVSRGQAELTTRLLAAASALRAQMGTPVRPVDQGTVEQTLATARSTLGDDAFAAVWAEALALPLEQFLSTSLSAVSLAGLGDPSRR
jgi:WD40 repeat protein/predicted ATPase